MTGWMDNWSKETGWKEETGWKASTSERFKVKWSKASTSGLKRSKTLRPVQPIDQLTHQHVDQFVQSTTLSFNLSTSGLKRSKIHRPIRPLDQLTLKPFDQFAQSTIPPQTLHWSIPSNINFIQPHDLNPYDHMTYLQPPSFDHMT